MRQLLVDVENTIDFPYEDYPDEIDGSPYNPNNKLVSVGFKDINTKEVWYFDDMEQDAPAIQALLDEAEFLIGHNIKHDIVWLKACGFRVPRVVRDTMVREYVFAKGRKISLSLKDCATRRKLDCTKGDLLDRMMIRKRGGEGLNIDQIPREELKDYNIDDLHVTGSLFAYQEENDWGVMTKALDLMHDTIPVLADMEMAGAAVDMDLLLKMEAEFKEKLSVIKAKLDVKLYQLMGDKPYNMNSPDDMSAVLYSRTPTNKEAWKQYFNIGSEQRGAVVKKKRVKILQPAAFNRLVNAMNTVYKARAEVCPVCDGHGYKRKIKKDGTPFAKAFLCSLCKGARVNYIYTGEVAGLKLKPRNEFVSQSGFAAGKDVIKYYLEQPNLSDDAREFLELVDQNNKYDTWINTFIASLKKYTKDGLIHTSYNQCVTATGRLSATRPNMQNQPKRSEDFPIRKVFISRWAGGKLIDADFGQLEFRIAAYLSQCEKAIQAVKDGVDIHSLTRDFYHGKLEYQPSVLQPEMTRQEAKAECVPMDSLILTRTGWKDYYTLQVGEEVLGYNQELDQTEWTRVLDKVKHEDVPTTTMYTNHNWKATCTYNHRWYGDKRVVRNKVRHYTPEVFTPETMGSEHRITVSAKAVGGDNPCSSAVAALIGWMYSDGSIQVSEVTGKTSQGKDGRRAAARACILQKKYTTEVSEVLSECAVTPTRVTTRPCGTKCWSLSAEDTRRIHREAGLDIRNPNFVEWVMSLDLEARDSFLEAVFLAEGHTREYAIKCITQNVGNFQEAIHLAAFMEGHDVRLTHKSSYTGKDCVRMTLRNKSHIGCQRVQMKADVRQDVWCPRTELGSWVMKQGDNIMITGNTFGPLYGKITEWTKQFYALFPGIEQWHEQLMSDVMNKWQIETPSGRVYQFPEPERFLRRDGRSLVSNHTQIKNYPVQGFATGDMVLLVMLDIADYLREHNAQSKLILQVHDSVTTDTHPDEIDLVAQAYRYAFDNVYAHAKRRFGIDINVPLAFDLSIGDNWLDQDKFCA